MQARVFSVGSALSALSLGLGFGVASCRGTLPPTEPPRITDEATPETRTNDAPALGPLAGDGVTPSAGGSGSGGSNLLPLPPVGGTGAGGAGGSAGSGPR